VCMYRLPVKRLIDHPSFFRVFIFLFLSSQLEDHTD
jgi:hypothetical protein